MQTEAKKLFVTFDNTYLPLGNAQRVAVLVPTHIHTVRDFLSLLEMRFCVEILKKLEGNFALQMYTEDKGFWIPSDESIKVLGDRDRVYVTVGVSQERIEPQKSEEPVAMENVDADPVVDAQTLKNRKVKSGKTPGKERKRKKSVHLKFVDNDSLGVEAIAVDATSKRLDSYVESPTKSSVNKWKRKPDYFFEASNAPARNSVEASNAPAQNESPVEAQAKNALPQTDSPQRSRRKFSDDDSAYLELAKFDPKTHVLKPRSHIVYRKMVLDEARWVPTLSPFIKAEIVSTSYHKHVPVQLVVKDCSSQMEETLLVDELEDIRISSAPIEEKVTHDPGVREATEKKLTPKRSTSPQKSKNNFSPAKIPTLTPEILAAIAKRKAELIRSK